MPPGQLGDGKPIALLARLERWTKVRDAASDVPNLAPAWMLGIYRGSTRGGLTDDGSHVLRFAQKLHDEPALTSGRAVWRGANNFTYAIRIELPVSS